MAVEGASKKESTQILYLMISESVFTISDSAFTISDSAFTISDSAFNTVRSYS